MGQKTGCVRLGQRRTDCALLFVRTGSGARRSFGRAAWALAGAQLLAEGSPGLALYKETACLDSSSFSRGLPALPSSWKAPPNGGGGVWGDELE